MYDKAADDLQSEFVYMTTCLYAKNFLLEGCAWSLTVMIF